MQRRKTRSDVALDLWDYFYVRHGPKPGDERPWSVIERATCRIIESASYLDPPMPLDVRVRSARRIRSAVRVATKQIELLSVEPPAWVIEGLAAFEVHADHVIRSLSEAARRVVLD
jgi:hypothetical protein